MVSEPAQATSEPGSELHQSTVRSCTRGRLEACCRRGEFVTMASKGVEASNVLEEERVRWETRGDARLKRRSRAVSPASLDVETAFEGRLADRGLATGDIQEQHDTLNFEEERGGTGHLASSSGRDKPRRTSSPCGGMETSRDGSDERPKRKHGYFLCGGPHWTRECPRRDALSAIARAGEESSHTGEDSHMEKSEPGEAEDVAPISPNQRQRPRGNVAKPEESSHKGEPKPKEARDVAQDAGEPRQQQDVDAPETCGSLREGSRHSTLGALTRASRALVGESVTAREFGG
ncbi:hypothetical protein SLEP1_g39259 [Rubroshorea leprosula]|uniref:Uncharacterized protein n=1 Tax=Rubroshorea leprosula TaxID=152421 RepID=A0AAV5KZM2_9ROSI|nr:hypothetical protein SLEP1_g39259 [Rubroshorea leprosula]